VDLFVANTILDRTVVNCFENLK